MTDMYAPNQQSVRADGSGPAEEGDGGAPGDPLSAEPAAEDASEENAPPQPQRAKAAARATGRAGEAERKADLR